MNKFLSWIAIFFGIIYFFYETWYHISYDQSNLALIADYISILLLLIAGVVNLRTNKGPKVSVFRDLDWLQEGEGRGLFKNRPIHSRDGILKMIRWEVGVAHNHLEGLVAEDFCDGPQLDPVHDKVAGAGVP